MQSESALVTKYVNTLEHLTLFFFCNAIAHTSMYSYIRRMHRCTLHVFMCTCVCVCMYGAQHALEWMGAAPGTRVCVSCAEWERSGVILPGVWSGFFESRSICALSRSKILLHPTSLCLDTIKEKKTDIIHLSCSLSFWLPFLATNGKWTSSSTDSTDVFCKNIYWLCVSVCVCVCVCVHVCDSSNWFINFAETPQVFSHFSYIPALSLLLSLCIMMRRHTSQDFWSSLFKLKHRSALLKRQG